MESGPVLMIRKYIMIVYNFCAPKISYVVGICQRHAKLYPFKAVKAEEDNEAGEEGFSFLTNAYFFFVNWLFVFLNLR